MFKKKGGGERQNNALFFSRFSVETIKLVTFSLFFFFFFFDILVHAKCEVMYTFTGETGLKSTLLVKKKGKRK